MTKHAMLRKNTEELFESFKAVIERPGYIVEAIIGEKKSGSSLYVRINGKRCRAQVISAVSQPNKNYPGYARIPVRMELSDEKAIVAVIDVAGATPEDFYVIPRADAVSLVRKQGHEGRRSVAANPVLSIPYPAREDCKLKQYRGALQLLA